MWQGWGWDVVDRKRKISAKYLIFQSVSISLEFTQISLQLFIVLWKLQLFFKYTCCIPPPPPPPPPLSFIRTFTSIKVLQTSVRNFFPSMKSGFFSIICKHVNTPKYKFSLICMYAVQSWFPVLWVYFQLWIFLNIIRGHWVTVDFFQVCFLKFT